MGWDLACETLPNRSSLGLSGPGQRGTTGYSSKSCRGRGSTSVTAGRFIAVLPGGSPMYQRTTSPNLGDPSTTTHRVLRLHMSNSTPTPRELVDRLDSRHEELIQKLDELNARIELTLAEYTRSRDNREYRQEQRKVA